MFKLKRDPADQPNSWRTDNLPVWGLFFVAPWIIGFMAFTVYPFFASLYFSFTNFNIINFTPRWVGLDNYVELFTADPLFWISIGNSIRYAALLLVAATIFDIFIAYLLSLNVRFLSIYRTIFFFPVLVPVVAASLTWIWILNPRFGLMNGLLDLIGVKGPNWLASPNTAMYSIILIAVWGSGRQVIVYLSGFNDIPRSLYEAADIDGASGTQKFWRITLPLLSPQIFFNVVTLIIFSLQSFSEVYIMTQGGPANSTLLYAVNLYNRAFRDFAMGYASALAWIMFLLILGLTLIIFKFLSGKVIYER
ncbi:MAG: sugar ABC transporter permease [Chloroflexi bacterium]|nr:sugar ABC transporter permease [Chloroflexota bacterium]